MWKFDTTKFNVAGMPSYMFFAGTGLMIALALYPLLLLRRNCKLAVFMPRLLYSLPAIFIGAKVLGMLLNIFRDVHKISDLKKGISLQSGIVYYGGLLGIIFTFYYLVKYKNDCEKKEIINAYDSFVVLIPLFHAFGRIGCFLSGCCYGIELKTRISVLYSINSCGNSIVTKWRIPTQLIEAMFEMIIFLLLLFLFMKNICCGRLLYVYLFLYSVVRFCLEFIRGDTIRGKFLILSTSQWISICLFVYVIIQVIKVKGNEENGKVF